MRLSTEFIRLPLTFDAARLASEIAQFDESHWRPHPEGHPGNSALSLVAIDGDPMNDSVKGTMRTTPHLAACPYLQQVLASFGAPIGRTRLMRLDGNAEARSHSDTNYYWLRRMRIHVPVVTDPAVTFICGERSVHMAAGESWVFDTWKIHNVLNPNPTRRIHLVTDTPGSPHLSSLLDGSDVRFVAFDEEAQPRIELEPRTHPVVMSPGEQTALVDVLGIRDRGLCAEIERFLDEWRGLWHIHAERRSGWSEYRTLLDRFDGALSRFTSARLDNGLDAVELVRQALVRPALNTDLAEAEAAPELLVRRRIERPVFIVSSPRAGSTLLFETMAQSPSVFTPEGESHAIIEGIDSLHPARRGWESNRLTADDATPVVASVIETRFLAELTSRDGGRRFPERVRMLEKTPKNCLRIPFLRAIYPDAYFIYLYRDPRATISSMIDAWESGKFVTYPELPGWEGPPWSLLLIPGWRELAGRPVEEIAAHQWNEATRIMLDDLETLPPESWSVASYDSLVGEPQKEIERLCAFVDIDWDRQLAAPLPLSSHTLTAPASGKWLRNGERIDRIAGRIQSVGERAREIFARTPPQRVRVTQREAPRPQPEEPPPFRSIHTSSLTDVLREVQASLAVTTYQSGRLVFVRRDGETTNTHFIAFDKPMGLAVNANGLAVGTTSAIWDYRNSIAVARRLDPPDKHDACFVPRNAHITGDVAVHELAFDAGGALWFVNTRFSSLCTLDADRSFIARWQPPFVTEHLPEDRCHLNGMAIIDGRPRLVTALSETNTPAGWRARKATSGALIDVDSGMTIVRGLSMPHSPRWYAGKVWLLESGRGSLMYVDTKAGRVETVALLPGFTRGLAFAGNYAFVGLSQVRESVFDGIPLAQRLRLDERACGIWAVDIRNGNIVAFLRFEEAVQEIFDVQVLEGIQFPELLDPGSALVQTHFEVGRG